MGRSLPKAVCKRCGHSWVKRVVEPKACPNCQSPYWDSDYTYKRHEEAPIGTKV